MEKEHRRCISCRKVAPKSHFWRVVRISSTLDLSLVSAGSQAMGSNQSALPTFAPTVMLDQGMGRSAYLCPRTDCLKAAQKKDRLSRALKTAVDPAFYQQLEQRLDQD